MKHEEFIARMKKLWPEYEFLNHYEGSTKEMKVHCKLHDEKFEITGARLSQEQTKCDGCKDLKKSEDKEEAIQEKFVSWFKRTFPDIMIHASGIFTNKNQVVKACNMGHCKGFPDVQIFMPNGMVFIEFKTKKGKVSEKQKECHQRLTTLGYTVHVCRDWKEAAELFKV